MRSNWIFLDDHVSRVAGDKTLVKVSTFAPITKANVRMHEPQGVDERLDPKHGEAQC
jgi:hypothetical protein